MLVLEILIFGSGLLLLWEVIFQVLARRKYFEMRCYSSTVLRVFRLQYDGKSTCAKIK